MTTVPTISTTSADDAVDLSAVITIKPIAASNQPARHDDTGRQAAHDRAARACDPATNASADGTITEPAAQRRQPSTSCRYCVMKMKAENIDQESER